MSDVWTSRLSLDEFDALVELLATSDAGDDSNFHIAPEGTPSIELRDTRGRLDYAKIRSLFLQRRAKRDGNHIPFSEPLHSESQLRGKATPEPTALSGMLLPKSLPTEETEECVIEQIRKDDDVHQIQSFPFPEAPRVSLVQHLQDTLSNAQEEVAQLRRQVLQLKLQVSTLFKSDPLPVQGVGDSRGYLAHVAIPSNSTLDNVQDASEMGTTVPTVPTNVDHSDLERSLQFVIWTDELVWRRSRYPTGPRAPVFSQSNIDAITKRLALWENIVRAPPP
ncbi:hypothetical protein F5148DRAFT_1182973 [Russula earlei]|uniref:Uncharacterized protein n=1 Tax=Russula earlei TaxID=71964 RepID=A0ACC0UEC6_9AGAM|nr:hypothetical protein F5148DRAFT_1182973 [Russula earlei]